MHERTVHDYFEGRSTKQRYGRNCLRIAVAFFAVALILLAFWINHGEGAEYDRALTPIGVFKLIKHKNHWSLQREYARRRGIQLSVLAFTDLKRKEIHYTDRQGLEHELKVCRSWEAVRQEARRDLENFAEQRAQAMRHWLTERQ